MLFQSNAIRHVILSNPLSLARQLRGDMQKSQDTKDREINHHIPDGERIHDVSNCVFEVFNAISSVWLH